MNASLISMFISYTDNGTVPFNQTMDFLRNQTLNETLGFTTPLPAEPIQLNYPLYMTICVSLFYTIIFLCGVGGNVLVLFVVWRNRDMRNSTNLFLVNLSAADLLVLIVCMPTAMAEFYGKEIWYIGEAMCFLVPFLENVVVHASILTILAITFERYYAICRPLEAQYTCTTKRTVKTLAVVWAIAIASTLPFPFIAKHEDATYLNIAQVKVCSTSIETLWQKVYVITVFIVYFIIPFFMLAIMYSIICRTLVSDNPVGDGNIESERSGRSSASRQRKQVVILLMGVIVLFFACNLPFRVWVLWNIFSDMSLKNCLGFEGYYNLINFVRIMFYLNSAGNPVLYNVVSTKFRDAFLMALGMQSRFSRRRATTTLYSSMKLSKCSSVRNGSNHVSTPTSDKQYENGIVRINSWESGQHSEPLIDASAVKHDLVSQDV